MPYIKQEERPRLDMLINKLSMEIASPGQLNYIITSLIKEYMYEQGLSYANIASVTGVINNVKDEFYRRVAVPYENKKIEENGDVY